MSGSIIKLELNPVIRAEYWQVRRAEGDSWAFYATDREDNFDVLEADFVVADREIQDYIDTLEILQQIVQMEEEIE